MLAEFLAYVCLVWYISVVVVCGVGYVQMYELLWSTTNAVAEPPCSDIAIIGIGRKSHFQQDYHTKMFLTLPLSGP